MSFILKTSGLHPVPWESGDLLLKNVDTLERGCILLDVRMPSADGIEVRRRLAAQGCGLPVIVMTGHAEVHLAVKAMAAGAKGTAVASVVTKLGLTKAKVETLCARAVAKLVVTA